MILHSFGGFFCFVLGFVFVLVWFICGFVLALLVFVVSFLTIVYCSILIKTSLHSLDSKFNSRHYSLQWSQLCAQSWNNEHKLPSVRGLFPHLTVHWAHWGQIWVYYSQFTQHLLLFPSQDKYRGLVRIKKEILSIHNTWWCCMRSEGDKKTQNKQ